MIDDQARGFLDRQRVAHLATADANGVPQVVPVCFALADETLYVAIDEKPKQAVPTRLKRLRNIAVNPQVALVADVYDDHDWNRLGWLMVRGTARVLDVGAEHDDAVRMLRAKYAQYRAMVLEERPVIAIDVMNVTTWGAIG
ncbi:MAG TPA: TIGR03668 family PPOX class F420-dependent oxidoreductase [Chloroflexota bacterium]|nr:TIGR03668 family PPOX class F420-dependent oxidoreductase [Chloroflexota bacterium]